MVTNTDLWVDFSNHLSDCMSVDFAICLPTLANYQLNCEEYLLSENESTEVHRRIDLTGDVIIIER